MSERSCQWEGDSDPAALRRGSPLHSSAVHTRREGRSWWTKLGRGLVFSRQQKQAWTGSDDLECVLLLLVFAEE